MADQVDAGQLGMDTVSGARQDRAELSPDAPGTPGAARPPSAGGKPPAAPKDTDSTIRVSLARLINSSISSARW